MATLEEVKKLKEQGMSEKEVITSLQERGIPPKEIQEALSQDKIKKAISNETPNQTPDYSLNTQDVNTNQSYDQNQGYYQDQQGYDMSGQYDENQGYDQNQGYYQDQQGYDPNQQYSPEYQSYETTTNTDTIMEVAEQVFEDKITKIKTQTEQLNEFKIIYETKIQDMSKRLEKIEKIIDNLQLKILDKIGSYGENLNSIKKEMGMMQDSFRKVVDTAIKDKQKVENKITKKKVVSKI